MSRLVKFFAIILMLSVLFLGIGDDVSAAKSKGPRIKTVVAAQNYVKIEWKKAKKAKGYCVFKKTGNGSYKKVAELGPKARSYIDNKTKIGTTYKYRVAAKKGGKLRYSKAKRITPKYIKPCKLKSVSNYYGSKKNRYSVITWSGSQSGCYYYIFRKAGGNYSHIATVKGKNGTQSYKDTSIGDGTNYTYTVRAIQRLSKKKKSKKTTVEYWGNYDSAGIRTVCQKVDVDGNIANFQNLKTYVKWKAVSGATNYYVYRKKSFGGSYKLLAKVDKSTTQYIDVYSKTLKTKDEKTNLFSEHFVDPDRNPYHYMVRAVIIKNGKISYGDYYLHGVFSLSQPHIMTVTHDKGSYYKVKFCEVYNAEKYELYSASKSGSKYTWHKLKTVKPNGKSTQTVTVKKHGKDTYFSVKALSSMKGRTIKSTFEKGFSIKNRDKLKGKKILYYGDSITYGSGYRGVYAYPIRVQQLLGGDYYNPSIPGATYSQTTKKRMSLQPSVKRDRMYDQVGVRMRDGTNVIKSFDNTVNIPLQPSWGRTFDKYDVVIMAAGTNDYLDNTEIGDINSADPHTFCGSINMTMKYIQDGSDRRVKAGKAPIKVVFLNQFYSDRTYYKDWGKRMNRFKTKNNIGLTLTDYQDAQNTLVAKYQNGYIFEPESGNTNVSVKKQDVPSLGSNQGDRNIVDPEIEESQNTSIAADNTNATETTSEVTLDNNNTQGKLDTIEKLDTKESPEKLPTGEETAASDATKEFEEEHKANDTDEGNSVSETGMTNVTNEKSDHSNDEIVEESADDINWQDSSSYFQTHEEAETIDNELSVLGLSNIKNGMKIYKMSTGFVNQNNCPYLMLDNLHLSRTGSSVAGNYLADFLIRSVY